MATCRQTCEPGLYAPRFRQNPDVIAAVIAHDDAWLVHFPTKLSYAVSRTGARIWRYLKEGSTQEELAARLAQETNLKADAAGKAVAAFVGELVNSGMVLVTEHDGPAAAAAGVDVARSYARDMNHE